MAYCSIIEQHNTLKGNAMFNRIEDAINNNPKAAFAVELFGCIAFGFICYALVFII